VAFPSAPCLAGLTETALPPKIAKEILFYLDRAVVMRLP